jgi:hypothetical protein
MKNIIFLILASLLLVSCAKNINQIKVDKKEILKTKEKEQEKELGNSKNLELRNRVDNLLMLIQSSNLDQINSQYIDKDFKIYEIFVDEDIEKVAYKRVNVIEELDDYLPSLNILFEKVNFNCSSQNDSSYGWEKDGVFLINNFNNMLLSFDIKEEEKDILKDSYLLIITNNISFYLSYIKNSWYITAVDKTLNDCSIK